MCATSMTFGKGSLTSPLKLKPNHQHPPLYHRTENGINDMIRFSDCPVEVLHKRNSQILQLNLQSLRISGLGNYIPHHISRSWKASDRRWPADTHNAN